MPTLFDIPDGDEVTYPGLQLASAVEREFDEQLSLVPWDDDDEDASCFDE